jgi:uncharacterized protein YggE
MTPRWLLPMLFPALLAAQTTRDSVVTASATRTARLPADRASLLVSIEGTAETAREAVARAESKAATVGEALRRIGAGSEIGRPMAFSVASTPTMRSFPSAPTGPSFTAKIAIRLVITNLNQLSALLAAALDAGATTTSTAAFEASAADSVRRKLATDALTAARADVQTVAASLGGQLGALVDAGTSTPFSGPVPSMFFPVESFSQQTTAPEVTFTVTANVRYRLVR